MSKNKVTLNKKFAKKWINALRSGKFKQCSGELKKHKTSEYCCLGVACAIAGINKPLLNGVGLPTELTDKQQKTLPPFFREESNGGNKDCLGYMSELADLNDNGKSFKYIADMLERKFKLKEKKVTYT